MHGAFCLTPPLTVPCQALATTRILQLQEDALSGSMKILRCDTGEFMGIVQRR